MRFGVVILGILAAALGTAGCHGSTEPATRIDYDTATLNGRGTTGEHGTFVFFEYWPAARPDAKSTSPGRDIPAGVTGPFSAPPSGGEILKPATPYVFRLCGRDTGAAAPVCAQTRTFTTRRPAGDHVSGQFGQSAVPGFAGEVLASGDTSGGHPTGTLDLPPSSAFPNGFGGAVTCLQVSGNLATVGAVGSSQTGDPAKAIFAIRDGDPVVFDPAADRVSWADTHGAAPNCATAAAPSIALAISSVSVYDAP